MLELLALFILIQYEMHFFQPESIMKYPWKLRFHNKGL